MAIPFTQYLLADGRKRTEYIDRPWEVEALAQQFIASGGRFECEILTTGEVSLTAHRNGEDVAIEICANGPEVPRRVDALVRAVTNGAAPHA